ncbi:MAG: GIY-YIG nuclease family protein [Candidatus Levybacteria bacterium]|nr:GIY-YIG nuclease family protein [Candidatus Levybacteria bacterium]
MYTVYLLESVRTGKWYIGYTPDEAYNRLRKHNRKEVVSTKAFAPWKLIYFECYLNRSDATGRERFLKSGAGRNFLRKQLKYYLGLSQRVEPSK